MLAINLLPKRRWLPWTYFSGGVGVLMILGTLVFAECCAQRSQLQQAEIMALQQKRQEAMVTASAPVTNPWHSEISNQCFLQQQRWQVVLSLLSQTQWLTVENIALDPHVPQLMIQGQTLAYAHLMAFLTELHQRLPASASQVMEFKALTPNTGYAFNVSLVWSAV